MSQIQVELTPAESASCETTESNLNLALGISIQVRTSIRRDVAGSHPIVEVFREFRYFSHCY